MGVPFGLVAGSLDDRPDPSGEAWHLEQGEREASRRKIGLIPSMELATGRHAAHLVVELRPADPPAVVAEADERDHVGGRWLPRRPGPRGDVGQGRPLRHAMAPSRSVGVEMIPSCRSVRTRIRTGGDRRPGRLQIGRGLSTKLSTTSAAEVRPRWRSRPERVPTSTSPAYAAPMSFDVAADAYDRFMGRYSRLLSPQLADFAGVVDGQRVLDVGCGPGALTAELARRLGAANVSAADPSEPFVSAARARNPGVDVRQASAEH